MRPEKRFFRKLFLFLGLPVVMVIALAFILPFYTFSFRAWEALRPIAIAFDGEFYPNQYLSLTEYGDLGHGTAYAVPKEVVFQTDDYGFRYAGSLDEPFDIVIVGDSYTVGSSLTQDDTIAYQLTQRLGVPVYPYAPMLMHQYIRDPRFATQPPAYVILQRLERNLDEDSCPVRDIPSLRNPTMPASASNTTNMRIRLDMGRRNIFYSVLFFSSLHDDDELIINKQTKMMFYEDSIHMPQADIDNVVAQLLNCEAWLAERGSQLILMITPDKETIYFEDIPAALRPNITYEERRELILDLNTRARQEGIMTIDLVTAYETARDSGHLMYQLDDTHWNKMGVNIAVDLIVQMIDSDMLSGN